jgi:O-antigen/teichoic acid export membrane protein
LQGVLVTRLLGPAGFGLIGVVMAFASTVNSIFSFRMSELVVRYGGEYLNKGEKEKASAIMKAAGLTEGAVSLAAFLVVMLTAGLAETYLAKTPNVSWMFTVYALGLLANFNTETSTGYSSSYRPNQIARHDQSCAEYFYIHHYRGRIFPEWKYCTIILVAYLLGKSILGLGMFITAQVQLHKVLGAGWWRTPFSVLKSTRQLIRFALSSNISATIIKIFRESELIWIGFFLDTTAVGYYRVAYTIVHFLAIPC